MSLSPVPGPAPRQVSRAVAVGTVFGRAFVQIGFGLVGFSMIFVLIFVADSELMTRIRFRGPVATTPGEVVAVGPSNAKENGRRIYDVDFRYQVDGTEHTGTSHGFHDLPKPGEVVTVEHLVAEPGRARIAGLRMHRFHSAVGVLGFMPIIGLVFLAVGLTAGFRALGLLRRGEPGWARLVSKRPTNMRVNKRPVLQLFFELELPPDPSGQPYREGPPRTATISTRTHEPEKLEDDAREPALYDPQHPSRAVLVHALNVAVGDDGTLRMSKSPWPWLIIPVVVMLEIAVFSLLLL